MAHLIRQGVNHPSREGHTGSLWQGGIDDVMAGIPYDMLVLCADEFQPAAHIVAKANVEVVHAPNDDSGTPLTRGQVCLAIAASRVAARAFREGKKVLISCAQGRNRSGLVTALTLHRLYGFSGDRARDYIRDKVPHALSNLYFTEFLAKVRER